MGSLQGFPSILRVPVPFSFPGLVPFYTTTLLRHFLGTGPFHENADSPFNEISFFLKGEETFTTYSGLSEVPFPSHRSTDQPGLSHPVFSFFCRGLFSSPGFEKPPRSVPLHGRHVPLQRFFPFPPFSFCSLFRRFRAFPVAPNFTLFNCPCLVYLFL